MKNQDIERDHIAADLRECSLVLSKLYVDTADKITVEQSDAIADINSMLRDIARRIQYGEQ